LLLVLFWTFGSYIPVFFDSFVRLDDYLFLVDNPHFRGFSPSHLAWMFTNTLGGPYQPIPWLTYALDYLLWGMVPWGYHLTSLLLHCINSGLLYYLAKAIYRRSFPEQTGHSIRLAAAIAALLFSLHPLRVEVVAWASARRDLLSTFFTLILALYYVHHRNRDASGTFSIRKLVIIFVLFCFALASKPIVVGLPIALLYLDWNHIPKRRALRDFTILLIPVFVFTLIGFVGQKSSGAVSGIDEASLWTRVVTASYAAWFYIEKTFFPVGLAPQYLLVEEISNWRIWFPASAIVCLATLVTIRRHRNTVTFMAVTGIALFLFPVIGFIKIGAQFASDRYWYIPGVILSLAVGLGFLRLRASLRPHCQWLMGAAASVLILLSAATWRQCFYWRDSETIYNRILAVNPSHGLARAGLAGVMLWKGEADSALQMALEALRSYPSHTAYVNAGLALVSLGRYAEAADMFQTAVRIRPDDAKTYVNLAKTQLSLGNTTAAESSYRQALKINSSDTVVLNNYGNILEQQGKLEEAVNTYKSALSVDSSYAKAHANLAVVFARLNRKNEAVEHFEEAIRLDPSNIRVLLNFGSFFAQMGKMDEAARRFEEALHLDPNAPEIHNNLGRIRWAQGRRTEAILQYRLALKADPNYAAARANLERALRSGVIKSL